MDNYLLISDAAKEVKVESHVLRYWEEELHLPIKRNELGHRYYTQEDVERFKQIKGMKERGLQLKAIKMILRDGRLDVLPQPDETDAVQSIVMGDTQDMTAGKVGGATEAERKESNGQNLMENGRESIPEAYMAIDIVNCSSQDTKPAAESKDDKSKRLQWLLQQLIRETLRENNQELSQEIKESIIKELDYQFRSQEEREEEREKRQDLRNEEYYRKMDELLRKKSRGLFANKNKAAKVSSGGQEKGRKKKRHSI